VRLKGYANITQGSEDDLKDAIFVAGPVAVAIDASAPDFRYYESGVYYSPVCKNGLDDLDHAVLAIGYGSDDGHDYWLIKNSWSVYWGEKGFVRMSRNHGNNCGVATQANYPVISP